MTGIINFISGAYFLARGDILVRYRRSVLGPAWLVLTTLISVLGLAFVWGAIFNVPNHEIVPSITIGLIVWQFISTNIVESPSGFVRYSALIRNYSIRPETYSLQLLFRNTSIFLHNFLIIIVVLLVYREHWSLHVFLFIPGFILLFLFLLGASIFLSIFGARFRDVEQIVSAIMPILFFVTPIIFKADQLGKGALFIQLNPFAHYVAIVRNPLLGQEVSELSIYVTTALSLTSIAIAILTLRVYRKKIAYWVG
jgi:ABC-type polysaccharide/polyol phosphate export permease